MILRVLETGLANAVAAPLIAAIALLASRMRAKEPLVHSLWVLVLIKLVTPVLFEVPIGIPACAVVSDVPLSKSEFPRVTDAFTSASHDTEAGTADPRWQPAAAPSPRVARSISATSSIGWSSFFGFVWLLGSLCCLLVTVWRASRFQRLLSHTALASKVARDRARMLSQRMGLRRSPRIRVTAGVISPLVWCPLPFSEPTIVLPSRLLAELSDGEQTTLLLHELAHLRRRDHWVRWLEVVTAVCFWWHPIVWWARRELQRTGDLCCDGWVLSCAPELVRNYAKAIVRTIDFLAEAKPVLPPMASAVGQVEFIERRIQMILRNKLDKELSWPVRVVMLVAATIVLPLSSRLVAEDGTAAERPRATSDARRDEGSSEAKAADSDTASAAKELPRTGVLEVVMTIDGKPVATKSMTRALAKLEAFQKARARRPESSVPSLVTINVNDTTLDFTDVGQAIGIIKGISEILDAAKKFKIQLGELGYLDAAATQSQQSQETAALQTSTHPTSSPPPQARDGDDGFGIGGGLGGQGGGGYGAASQQQALEFAALRRSGAAGRELQIAMLRRRLSQLLTPPAQSDQASPSVVGAIPSPKKVKLGQATLFSRMVHRDYQKATFSFEFGLRDDPTYLHRNDWDLQYGNGGEHFHVAMVSDDRSRIVDLGQIDWGQLDTTRLAKLPAHPQPRREFVPTAPGHVYMVHTVDRNSDLYALFRVERVDPQQGTCDITWRLVDAPQ